MTIRATTAIVGILAIGLGASLALAVVPTKDTPGTKDDPALKRFAGSVLVNRTDVSFDDVSLVTGKLGADGKTSPTKKVEGRHSRFAYVAPDKASTLEVSRNYRNSITAGGGQVLFECAEADCGGADVGGKGAWIQTRVFPAEKAGKSFDTLCTLGYQQTAPFGPPILNVRYFVAKLGGTAERYVSVLSYVVSAPYDCAGFDQRTAVVVQLVDPKGMGDSMVTIKAADMASAIGAQGRVALYGIFFDTDKAEVKDQSAPTLVEIATLLSRNPALKLLVVGHTDGTGNFDHNVALSKQRALAVTQALTTKHGVAAARLRAEGVGMLAPSATNDTEEGRARNRRVELVKMN